jgi:2-keto-4-pentenoate hydratase/2-oxohepta-3-ene-1,7-dioic acid hydratase in catechol pathway
VHVRLVTFEVTTPLGRVRRIGSWSEDDVVVDINLAYALKSARDGSVRPRQVADAHLPAEMVAFLSGGAAARDTANDVVQAVLENGDTDFDGLQLRYDLSEVRLLSPLPRPNSIRDFLMVEGHVRNAMARQPPEKRAHSIEDMAKTPAYYKGNVDTVLGPGDEVPWPAYTEQMDYELELGVVIGKGGRNIPADRVHEHVAGYTLFNDWSARDIQMEEMKVGIGPGLGKDFANSLGPAIRTADGFDPVTAHLEARIDGEVWSSGTIGAMLRTFDELVCWTSQAQGVRPGDVIGSGTIENGCGLELGRYLSPGALVELEADGIGVLANRIGQPEKPE